MAPDAADSVLRSSAVVNGVSDATGVDDGAVAAVLVMRAEQHATHLSRLLKTRTGSTNVAKLATRELHAAIAAFVALTTPPLNPGAAIAVYARIRLAQLYTVYCEWSSLVSARVDSLVADAAFLAHGTADVDHHRFVLRDVQARALLRNLRPNPTTIDTSRLASFDRLCIAAVRDALARQTPCKWATHFLLLRENVIGDLVIAAHHHPRLALQRAPTRSPLTRATIRSLLTSIDETCVEISNAWGRPALPLFAILLLAKARIIWLNLIMPLPSMNSTSTDKPLSSMRSKTETPIVSSLIGVLEELEYAANGLNDLAQRAVEKSAYTTKNDHYRSSISCLSLYCNAYVSIYQCLLDLWCMNGSWNSNVRKNLKALHAVYDGLMELDDCNVNSTISGCVSNSAPPFTIMDSSEPNLNNHAGHSTHTSSRDQNTKEWSNPTKSGILTIPMNFDCSDYYSITVFSADQLLVIYKYLAYLSTRTSDPSKSIKTLTDALSFLRNPPSTSVEASFNRPTEERKHATKSNRSSDVVVSHNWYKRTEFVLLKELASVLIGEERFCLAMSVLKDLDSSMEARRSFITGAISNYDEIRTCAVEMNATFATACQSMGLFEMMEYYIERARDIVQDEEEMDIDEEEQITWVSSAISFDERVSLFLLDVNSFLLILGMPTKDSDKLVSEKAKALFEQYSLLVSDPACGGIQLTMVEAIGLMIKGIMSYIPGTFRPAKDFFQQAISLLNKAGIQSGTLLISLVLSAKMLEFSNDDSTHEIFETAILLASKANKTAVEALMLDIYSNMLDSLGANAMEDNKSQLTAHEKAEECRRESLMLHDARENEIRLALLE